MPATAVTTEIPELRFAAGLPGFPEAHRFALVRWGDTGPFSVLRSLDVDALEFLVVPPNLFFPDYAPELDNVAATRLRLDDADDALLLVVVTLGDRAEDATANLMAPIVVHRATLEAAQVVLDRSGYDVRVPLLGGEPDGPGGTGGGTAGGGPHVES